MNWKQQLLAGLAIVILFLMGLAALYFLVFPLPAQ